MCICGSGSVFFVWVDRWLGVNVYHWVFVCFCFCLFVCVICVCLLEGVNLYLWARV